MSQMYERIGIAASPKRRYWRWIVSPLSRVAPLAVASVHILNLGGRFAIRTVMKYSGITNAWKVHISKFTF